MVPCGHFACSDAPNGALADTNFAIEKKVKFSGCTVHYVNHLLDGGEIIDQSIVKLEENETVESLKKKILIQEHKLYINVLNRISKGLK